LFASVRDEIGKLELESDGSFYLRQITFAASSDSMRCFRHGFAVHPAAGHTAKAANSSSR
jgi:hypothetical protein